MATRTQIIEFLSDYEAVSSAALDRAVRLHESRGGSFARLLVEEGIVDEEDLFFLMSRRLSVPAIPAERLRHLALSPEIRRRVPRRLARQCVLVPLDLDIPNGRLSVAMFDPTDHDALDTLRRVSRVTEIRAYLARRATIMEVLEALYSEDDDALASRARDELPVLGTLAVTFVSKGMPPLRRVSTRNDQSCLVASNFRGNRRVNRNHDPLKLWWIFVLDPIAPP